MAGMLPGLFSPSIRDLRTEQQDEESRLARLADDPFKADAYTAYSGAKLAGQGLARAAGGAFGLDTRTPTERNVQAVAAAKAQVSQLGFNPDDPKSIDEFYKRVVQILQQQGLAAEAMEVAKEWRAAKTSEASSTLKVRELERKEKADLAKDARAKERNDLLKQRNIPEFARYFQVLEDTADPEQRRMLTDRLNQMLGKSGKGVKAVDYGDHVDIVDAATGETISSADKGAAPMNEKDAAKAGEKTQKNAAAYRTAKSGMQQQYDAAVDLYNMPGFDAIFGRTGQYIGKEGVAGTAATLLSSDSARAAFEKWKQVTGATFLAGLTQLRQTAAATGGTGTGLGAVSNIEGDKVQAAGAALGRSQDAASARTQLRVYIQTLVTASENIDGAAKGEGIAPAPLAQKALTGPQRGRQSTAAPQAPLIPPAAPTAPQPASSPPPAGAPKSMSSEGWSIKRKQ